MLCTAKPASPRISSFNVMSNLKKKYSIGKPYRQTKIELIETKKLKGFKDKEIVFFCKKNVCLGYSKIRGLEKRRFKFR